MHIGYTQLHVHLFYQFVETQWKPNISYMIFLLDPHIVHLAFAKVNYKSYILTKYIVWKKHHPDIMVKILLAFFKG